jgi:hypothetical protein
MKERPILFSGPMVRAILEGRKTVTRRVVKPQPWMEGHAWLWAKKKTPERPFDIGWAQGFPAKLLAEECPYGQPGDRLWVKETWGYANACPGGDALCREDWVQVGYRASDSPRGEGISDPIPRPKEEVESIHAVVLKEMERAGVSGDGFPQVCRWRSSLHMPRNLSRLSLEVVSVRAEQLHDITPEDVLAEGIQPILRSAAIGDFNGLWNKINGKRAPWESNPWVWVVSFRRIQPETGGAK